MNQQRKKILVIDDDDVLREFYVRVFDNFGYGTVCASDGDEGISLLRKSPDEFALVILDMLMPVKSGWDVIRGIRETPELAEKPVIAITGISADDEQLKKLSESCDEVILKGDFEMTRLSEAVERLLGESLVPPQE